MSDTIRFILSLSIVFAAIIGAIRFKKIDPSYRPFIYYAWMGLAVEIIVHILLVNKFYFGAIGLLNVYSLLEFYLLTWLFYNWGLFKRKKQLFVLILSGAFVAWVILSFFVRGFEKQNLYFLIAYSLVLIFFSISAFNKMVVNDRSNIFKNPKFWICIGIIIFYTYFIVSTTAKIPFLKNQMDDKVKEILQGINAYANLFVNLLYAVAVIWVPRKKNIMTL